jgi:hypothetical protein
MLSDTGFADWADVQRIAGATSRTRGSSSSIGNFLGLKGEANETLGMVVDFANRLILDADTQDSLRAALQASGRALARGARLVRRRRRPPVPRRPREGAVDAGRGRGEGVRPVEEAACTSPRSSRSPNATWTCSRTGTCRTYCSGTST